MFTKKFGKNSLHTTHQLMKDAEAKQTREQVDKTVIELRTQQTLLESSVQRDIINARKLLQRTPVDASAKRMQFMTLRTHLGQYWYLKAMLENLENMQAQMKLMEMTVEFGKAMENVTKLSRGFAKQQMDFDKMTESFLNTIKPFDNTVSDQFERMSDALIQASQQSTNASQYSDVMIQNIIEGKTDWMTNPKQAAQPVMYTEEPVVMPEMPQPAQTDTTDDDLLDELRRMSDALRG